MINIINYIEKLLAKEIKGSAKRAATNLVKISTGGPIEIISAGDDSHRNREYNKDNLWIAFNRYELDAVQSDKSPGEYSFKSHNRATP